MATTGYVNRSQGKWKIRELAVRFIIDPVSGILSKPESVQTQAMTVTATANTDFTISVPANATIKSMLVYTTTAFLAATDAKISVGTSAGDQTYVAQTSIKAGGVVALSFAATAAAAAAMLAAPATPNLFVRIVQTGTTSATGAATLVISYVIS